MTADPLGRRGKGGQIGYRRNNEGRAKKECEAVTVVGKEGKVVNDDWAEVKTQNSKFIFILTMVIFYIYLGMHYINMVSQKLKYIM